MYYGCEDLYHASQTLSQNIRIDKTCIMYAHGCLVITLLVTVLFLHFSIIPGRVALNAHCC